MNSADRQHAPVQSQIDVGAELLDPVKVSSEPRVRLVFLDGLRGIAIIMVVLFHAYVRWPELVPYGRAFSHVSFFSYGFLGVELFFLISGFVILMTLEKCRGFSNFMLRRWLRLFPAMFIATVAILLTSAFFEYRPAGKIALNGLMSGLLFVDPAWLTILFGSHQTMLEGAFWSLFLEVKFYVIAGLLFIYFGEKKMLAGLICIFLAGCSISLFPILSLNYSVLFLHEVSSVCFFGWFATGSLYFRYYQSRDRKLLLCAICIGLASAAFDGSRELGKTLASVWILCIFSATVLYPSVQRLISHRFFTFFGYISYPLYLIHENMMVSMIVQLGHAAQFIPWVLLPVLPIIGVISVAAVIARYMEPSLRNLIKSSLRLC